MRDNVGLRDVTTSDLPVFFTHQMDAESSRMAAFKARDWNAFTVHWAKILADATVTKKTILCNGQVAGNIVCWGPPGERLVGYWIGREYWGRGIATGALSLFLGEVRERPLFAHVAKHNRGSIRVLEKCAFTLSCESTATFDGAEVEEFVLRLDASAAPAGSHRVSGGGDSRR